MNQPDKKGVVLQFPASAVGTNERKTEYPDSPDGSSAPFLRRLKQAFFNVVNNPMEKCEDPSSTSCGKLVVGAYGMHIHHPAKGPAKHYAGTHIDQMRQQRRFTSNAVQLRCDALGMAIYVSGVTQIVDKVERKMVRVVMYDFKNIKHTHNCLIPSTTGLYDKLYGLLLANYNKLSRQFNLVGISKDDYILKSDNPAFPDIRLFPEGYK